MSVEQNVQSALQALIIKAMDDRKNLRVGGFVVVRWQDRYSHVPTPIPHAHLETIVQASTRAEIVARYRWTENGWQEILLERSIGEDD